MKSIPTCHPDRKCVGDGLCGSCYNRVRLNRQPPAKCHPGRPVYSDGICNSCYNRRSARGIPPNVFRPVVATREELAWLSGVFCGEGCVYCTDLAQIAFSIGQSGLKSRPPEMLSRVERILGMGKIYKSGSKPGHKQPWQFRVGGHERVQAIVALLWTWLTPEKKKQASTALAKLWRLRPA